MGSDVNEQWKSIPGYEGFYSVSNFGRVRSEDRIIKYNTNPRFKDRIHKAKGQILNPSIDNAGKGYYRVTLSKSSKLKFFQVHRLVMLAFIGERPNGFEIRHIDGNCRNNCLNNLTYGTKSENMQDAIRHGTFPLAEKRPGAKLNREIVKDICIRGMNGEMADDIGNIYGVRGGTIRQIWKGKTWKNFTNGIRPDSSKNISKKYHLLTKEQIDILYDTNKKVYEIAKIIGVDRHTITEWRCRKIGKPI